MSVDHQALHPAAGTGSSPERLTIILEPLHGSILKSIVNTLGTMGSGTWRFVAITDTEERLEGPTFISPRNLGGDQTPHPEWAPDMSAALADLQRELEQVGWRKVERGTELWSWTYRR
ncbi:MAG TPA: hypothetical protein VIU11_09145 [Nakamurella sp.]